MEVKLLVVHGRPNCKSLIFPRGSYVFGRGAECHIRPNSELVSRQHCQLLVTSNTATLRDLGSRNGTLLNGERLLGARDLADGDQIQIGPLAFAVKLENQPQTPGAAEGRSVEETDPYCLDTAQVRSLIKEANKESAPATPEKASEQALPAAS